MVEREIAEQAGLEGEVPEILPSIWGGLSTSQSMTLGRLEYLLSLAGDVAKLGSRIG